MPDKPSVLVVDDEPIVGKRLGPALQKRGYEVEHCQDGKEALERIRERYFDIVVTDVRMPEVDGLEVLRAVEETKAPTQVIIITGYATMEMAREAQSKGAFDVIAKPFRPQELLAVIARALKAQRAEVN
jgi:DNA-binding NtrC family response regulator